VRAFIVAFLLLTATTLLMLDYQQTSLSIQQPEAALSDNIPRSIKSVTSTKKSAHPFGKSNSSSARQTAEDAWINAKPSHQEYSQNNGMAGGSIRQGDQMLIWERQTYTLRDDIRTNDEYDDTETAEESAAATSGIFGWVQNESGEPLPGIQVSTRMKRLLSEDAATPGKKSTQAVYTDSDGQFRFNQLPSGEYLVRAHGQGRSPDVTRVVRTDAGAVILQMDGQATSIDLYLYGAVISEDGLPLSGVHVVPVGHKTNQTIYTDTSGYYGFNLITHQAGHYPSLRFMLNGFHDKQVSVSRGAVGDTAVQIDAQLEPVGSVVPVSGSVQTSHGEAVPGAVVELYSFERKGSYRGVSDGKGQFLIPNVEVGTHYRIQVQARAGHRDYIQDEFYLSASNNRLSIQLEALRHADLKGQMLDLDGNPVSHFSLWMRSSQPTEQPDQVATSDNEGYFTVVGLPEGEISFMTRSLPRMAIGGIRLVAGVLNSVMLIVDEGDLTTQGQVVMQNGEPVAGAQATLIWSHNYQGRRSSSRRTTHTDMAGSFSFVRLGPGPHTLIIEAAGYQTARLSPEADTQTGAAIEIKMKDL